MTEKRMNQIVEDRNYLNCEYTRDRFFSVHKEYQQKKLYNCNARIALNSEYAWLWSYDTIVAVYDRENMELLVFGRYSATTYQHIRKFRTWLLENEICYNAEKQLERNLELENWFK